MGPAHYATLRRVVRLSGILLAIAVVAVMGSRMANVIIAVAIFSIPAFARLVRGNTLVLKAADLY